MQNIKYLALTFTLLLLLSAIAASNSLALANPEENQAAKTDALIKMAERVKKRVENLMETVKQPLEEAKTAYNNGAIALEEAEKLRDAEKIFRSLP
jgi:GTPase Era involved in 16S rRNA processing